MVIIVKHNKETLTMAVMKMVSMFTKSTKSAIDRFTFLVMRRVLRCKVVRFVEKNEHVCVTW